MHGSLMLYLFAGPFAFGGLANYIVPLQVGAPDMAFPRLNALSYWLYLGGSHHHDVRVPGRRRRGQLRLGGLRPAVQRHQLPRGRGRPVADGARPHRVLGHLHRGQPVRHHLLPAGAGDDHVPGAHLLVEHAGHRHPHPDRLPGAVRRGGPALLRPPLRHPHLHRAGRRRTRAVAEPLLVLRPSRGVHPGLALLRHGHRHHPGVLAQAAVRLQGHGLRHHVHRRPVHRGVGPPHVHHRRGAAALLLAALLPDRRPHRDQVLQLDRDHVGRPAELPDAHAVLASGSSSPS